MNKYVINVFAVMGLVLTFILEMSAKSVFPLFTYFSPVILFLFILSNIPNTSRAFLINYFVLGMLVDWYNKAFLGLSSLFSVALAYVYYVLVENYGANKIIVGILNFAGAYLFFLIIHNFQELLTFEGLVSSFVITALTAVLWMRG